MIIYHGSYATVEIPEIRKARFTKDFGVGFYCTELKKQAQRWASKFQHPTLNIYQYEPNETLCTHEFLGMTDEWLDFIVACRTGKPHSYDTVSGAMADDQIYTYLGDFIEGRIPRDVFFRLASFQHPTQQIVFCTKKALECLHFMSSEEAEQDGELSRTTGRK